MHLADLLTRHAAYRRSAGGVVFEGRRLDWPAFDREVNRLAHAMCAVGVGHGERVATVLPNCLELLQTYWACAKIGAVAVPLSPLLAAQGLRSLLADAEPRLTLGSAASAQMLAEACATLAAPPLRWTVDPGERPDSLGLALAGRREDAPAHRVQPEDSLNIMYTSGTTGLPKGIVHTHRIRAHYATLFANAWRMTPESVVLHTGAMVFNGAFVTLLPAFLLGCRYVLAPRFDPRETLATIERERVTHTMMVPAQIAALLQLPEFDAARLGSLEMLLSLGAPLPLAHKELLEQRLPGRLYELYGLTEGFVTILDRSEVLRKTGSVGVPPPFFELRIVREDGSQAEPGEVGEVVGRGPILMPGYFRRPDLTAAAIRAGWLHTGDLGRVDEDGFLTLVDRKKDMIISGGVKVYPSDIEAVLVRHPAVREAAVYGIAHARWGEAPMAAVTLRDGASIDPEVLRDWANQRVAARYQRLLRVVVLDEFPRNAAGKVLKRELRARA